MEESFCRLGIFIRPCLQLLLCFLSFTGFCHAGDIVYPLFPTVNVNQFFTYHHNLSGIRGKKNYRNQKPYLQQFICQDILRACIEFHVLGPIEYGAGVASVCLISFALPSDQVFLFFLLLIEIKRSRYNVAEVYVLIE